MTAPVRVLAVDDRRENLLALQAILEGLPIEVVPVTNGEDALKQLLVKDYALILLDARMPGMDGFETARHVKQRERTRHIPILFLTAADYDPHMAFRGYQAGAVDYITKPFDPWVLRSKVAVFVDLWTMHTQLADRAAECVVLRSAVDEALNLLESADPAAVEQALAQVRDRWGRLDGAIDVIGAALFKPFTETTDDEWDGQVDLVIRHAFRVLRAAAPLIERSGGGSIGFVSSIAGVNAAPSYGTYGMFKSAMMSMARSAAVELGPAGIRVNCVAPGATRTARLLATQSADMLEVARRSTPLRKAAEPSDIAAGLAFLASPMAGHITGQTLVIDGGASLMNARELSRVGIPQASS